MNTPQHLSLVNIDSLQNRRRVYVIEVATTSRDGFKVILSWGRINSHRRSLTTVFEQKNDMVKYIETLLKRRKRNGYHIIDKSGNFPHSPTLELLPVTDNIAGQMKLF